MITSEDLPLPTRSRAPLPLSLRPQLPERRQPPLAAGQPALRPVRGGEGGGRRLRGQAGDNGGGPRGHGAKNRWFESEGLARVWVLTEGLAQCYPGTNRRQCSDKTCM